MPSLHQCQCSLYCEASPCSSSSSESCPQLRCFVHKVRGLVLGVSILPTLPWCGWLLGSGYTACEDESTAAWPHHDTTVTLKVHLQDQAVLPLAGFLLRFHPCLPSSPSLLPNLSAHLSGCCWEPWLTDPNTFEYLPHARHHAKCTYKWFHLTSTLTTTLRAKYYHFSELTDKETEV